VHGLAPGGAEIDDGKPSVAQSHTGPSVKPNTHIIRAAVRLNRVHRLKQSQVQRALKPAYSTHLISALSVVHVWGRTFVFFHFKVFGVDEK
jgi:hypothetical protein